MNLCVTGSTTGVLRILVVSWTGRFIRTHAMLYAMASQAKVVHCTELQHSRVSRSMRHVTRDTSIGLNWSMFEREGTLFIRVTSNACGVGANRQPGLLQFESPMRVVAIAASHCAFKDFVMRRHCELMFDFTVTAQAQLWLAIL